MAKKPTTKPGQKPDPGSAPQKKGSDGGTTKTPPTKTTTTTPSKGGTQEKGGGKKSMTSISKSIQSSIYEPVSHHIYFDGYSYRVRASIGGIRYSQNFSSKKKAFEFRKKLGLNLR